MYTENFQQIAASSTMGDSLLAAAKKHRQTPAEEAAYDR
jgi:hypothetical protein